MKNSNYSNPEKFKVNLKKLPPLDPNILPNPSFQIKPSSIDGRKAPEASKSAIAQTPNLKVEDGSFGSGSRKKTNKKDTTNTSDSNSEGTEKRPRSAKSMLHEICAVNKWKPPLFECCNEEGPSHMKMFTFKVMVEIRETSCSTLLECFSAPQGTKKSAVDHAAEGALWFLKHLGYFSKDHQ